jgi:hypothetical protein
MADEFFWERLIFGIMDKNLRIRFYPKKDMSLNEIIIQMKAVRNSRTTAERDIHNVNQMNRTLSNRSHANYRPELCETFGGKPPLQQLTSRTPAQCR